MNSTRGNRAHPEHGLGVPSFGFVLSMALTAAALWLVRQGFLQRTQMITGLLGLAVVQIFIQLFFFMHVNESDERAWHIWLLALGLLLVVTIVAGSIWIMSFNTEAY
ncbi:cytochrome C oxidase subunit IV family protein [Alicyclobacillus tolerans]|uniref:cytochrome o ubiquinol oxidase subunit IV n=1 Tax=Alicyclobacillus tolerans TaxID=90970 RepID=UPI001F027330|nr:cytochrome C oxidase subunit IV family protein [Alicyclobacillus tolerans]MCF8563174.1 cytochrome C oxidase subunit IV family protein [Alicyclobacillus tolerans]